jgi:uncharacterized integral membrane protein
LVRKSRFAICHGGLITAMENKRKARPIRITILAILILYLAAWNALRMGEAFVFWKVLKEYGADPTYISLSGAIWFIAGLLLAWGLWHGNTWAWMAALGCTIGYSGWYWFDRRFLQIPHANWPFVLIVNIVLLLLFFIILFSNKTKRYFKRDDHGRQPETPTTA